MDDLISRQAAIDALFATMPGASFGDVLRAVRELPSAQPESRREWYMKGYRDAQQEIIRCKDCKHRYLKNNIWRCPFGLSGGEDFFCGYGSQQTPPESSGDSSGTQIELKCTGTHESCTDCPLYDHDRHNCPRFNKVIPETLREVMAERRQDG